MTGARQEAAGGGMKPFKCPECGRYSKDGWEVSSSEYSAMWGATCKEHGEWRDST